MFGDPVVATAILNRLLHHCSVIIRGDSYRLREKRRAGLLQKAGTAHEQQNENVNQLGGQFVMSPRGSVPKAA